MGCRQSIAIPNDHKTISVPEISIFDKSNSNDFPVKLCDVQIQTDEEKQALSEKIIIDNNNMNEWKQFSKIGIGGLSICFSFINIKNGQLIVVKKVSNNENARKEFNILNKIHHTNIVNVYYLDECDIYMEYCAGIDLSAFCDKIGPMNECLVSHFLSQITNAIKYLHCNKNIIHCDIKPKNIMINLFGKVKLIDFGSSIFIQKDSKTTISNTEIEFTAIYAAPELILGTQITTAIDIWSIGCIIIKMVTSIEPWSENKFVNNSSALFHIAQNHSYPTIPSTFNLSIQLNDLLQQCLRRDLKQRITATQISKHNFLKRD